MMRFVVVALALCVALVCGQQAGTVNTEGAPSINFQSCTGTGGSSCTSENHNIVLDANWRWVHYSNQQNCYTGNTWDSGSCSSTGQDTCAQNCYLEQVPSSQYTGTYGIKADNGGLDFTLVTHDSNTGLTNIGARVYLLDTDNTNYKMFKLLNREFAFDVDVSQLPCGLNGALYFVEMAANGGKGVGNNAAGSKYGTGYCDAQCPHDIKFINGQANVIGWTPSSGDSNSGTGQYGSCCAEMDIWESNSYATAFTPHPCSVVGPQRCQEGTGTACGDDPNNRYGGVCDKDGCDFNSYRMGNKTFFGAGQTVNSNQKMTVVTQFITSDNTDTGDLVEIRRYYKQGDNVLANSAATFSSLNGANSITEDFCTAQKTLTGDQNDFHAKGGLKVMGQALGRGVVLVMSLWVDYAANCLWLDSNYPTNKDASTPGVARGACPTNSGVPSDVIDNNPSSTVKYSNIRFGTLGSTTANVPAPSGAGTSAGSGTTNAGTTNAGTTNAGTTNAGTTNAGTTNAGSTNGGSTNPGSTNGGATNGGSTNGGATNGGSTNGGSTNGGSTNGDATNAGSTNTGSTNTGSTNPASTNGASNTGAATSSCPVGSERCACMNQGGCDAGLTCLSNVCVKETPIASSASLLSVSALALFALALLF